MKNKMKNEIDPEKWSKEKWEEWFEWRASLTVKPGIANFFLQEFSWLFLVQFLLDYWLLGKYGLAFEKLNNRIPKVSLNKLWENLHIEIITFCIKLCKLREVRAGGEGFSFASLVEDGITSEEYKRAKGKYIKLRAREVYNFFSDSIENILRSSFSNLNLELTESRHNLFAFSHFLYLPLFLEEAIFGIFNWAEWLSAEKAGEIEDKINILITKKEDANFDLDKERIINFLESYGFGSDYCDKIWKKISGDIKHVEGKK